MKSVLSSLVRSPFRKRTAILALVTVLALMATGAALALADTAPDYAIAGGWFFTQTGGGQGNGYAVLDSADASGKPVKFWTEFQRLGGIDALGYPIGQPYVGTDGFTYQPFQRGVLQWHPELGSAVLSNAFEILQNAGKDDWLLNAKGVPKPIVDDGSAGVFSKAVSTRMGWISDSSIRAKFLANPNANAIANWNTNSAIQQYGLPMSQLETHGPFAVQRFQRVAFQLWLQDVPGMPPKGSIVPVLAGDLMKEAGLLPASSTQPLGPGGIALAPAATATPVATPTPAFSWTVGHVYGVQNCGTTYIRVWTRDANGNGINGISVKSWNDYGNVVVGQTSNIGSDGKVERIIGPGIRPGLWHVAVVDGSGNQLSETVNINFTGSCAANAGNVQEAEVEFRRQ